MRFIIHLLISTVAVMLTAWLLPGAHVSSFWSALIVALILAVLNAFLKPVLVFLTLPITVLTLGIFLLVINAALIGLASALVDGFMVDGFWWAVLFSLILSIISAIFGLRSDYLRENR